MKYKKKDNKERNIEMQKERRMRISKERKVGKQKKGRKGKLVEKVDEERHEKRRGGEKGGIKK